MQTGIAAVWELTKLVVIKVLGNDLRCENFGVLDDKHVALVAPNVEKDSKKSKKR